MPPYNWNDVAEKSKDDALTQLVETGCSRTAPYWQLANGSESPKWIARWFLYHKFRYRDGRNKLKHSKKRGRNDRYDQKRCNTLRTLIQCKESSTSSREKKTAFKLKTCMNNVCTDQEVQPVPCTFPVYHQIDTVYIDNHAAQLEKKIFDPAKDEWVYK